MSEVDIAENKFKELEKELLKRRRDTEQAIAVEKYTERLMNGALKEFMNVCPHETKDLLSINYAGQHLYECTRCGKLIQQEEK